MPTPTEYQGDWSRIAQLIVHQSLQTQPGERVIIHADPTFFPELTEQVRIEINKAGAVELFAGMLYSPSLETVRQQLRRREDPDLKQMEDQAMAELFALANIFIWLPNSWAHNPFQTENIIMNWPGRSIHFHWISGWWPPGNDPVLFRKLSAMYEEALNINYEALAAHQERIIKALQDSTVEVTTPAGTDIKFELSQAHFHQNNGNASKEFVNANARPGSARDREEELPAGVVRTVDVTNTQGRLVVPNETFPAWTGRQVGTLTFEFQEDRIASVHSQYHNDYVQGMWQLETGDKDRVGEFIIGANPALKLLPGHEHDGRLPYFGFGAGVVRFTIGDNRESGGTNTSSYLHNWLFLTDATVKANGRVIIDHGNLVLA